MFIAMCNEFSSSSSSSTIQEGLVPPRWSPPYISLFCATCLQLTVPIFLMSFSASYFHLALCLPLGHFWCKLTWLIFLVFLASSIHRRCLIHLKCGSLIKVPIMTFYNFSISVFVLIHPWLYSSTGQKIVLTVFLSEIVFFQLICLWPMFLHCWYHWTYNCYAVYSSCSRFRLMCPDLP